MKTNKYLNIAASVLMLAACAKEELVPSEELIPVSESTTVTFVASDGTKTVLGSDFQTTSWDTKENVLLWEEDNQLAITKKDYSDGKLTLTADVKSTGSTFFSIIGPEGDGNATRTSAAVLATQKPAQASFDPNAEILVAQPATCGEGNTVALRYNRPVAITVATLKNLEEGEKVLSVKITANENLTGKVNFTYDGTNVKAEMEGTDKTITCNYTTNNTVVQGNEGEGYIFPVYFISLKAEVMVFEFEVCTDKHKYYRKITRPEGSPIILNDNRVATFGFKLENADKADAEGDKFVKVTSEPTDWSGEYLLVYEASDSKALCWTGVDEASCYVETDVANGEIAAKPDGAVTLTIASIDNGYSIKVNGGDNNGKYIYGTSGSNIINFGTIATLNTLLYDSGVIITSNTSVMRYNNASNGKWFRYFKSTSYDKQQPVQLYKKTPGGYGKYTLATPKNIQYSAETQKITWDAVENAGKYTISLNGGESVECPSNEYNASTLAAEYYYATVVAYPSAEKEDTYKESEAGTNEGWFKIGEPTMKKIEAKDIDVLAGARSLEITWPEQTLATNGYSSELWSVGDDREKLQEKTEIAPDATSITYDKLEPYTKYRIYLTVKGVTLNDDRGERVYGECTTYKEPSTAQLFTIAEITKAGSYAIENAVVVAKANDGFLVKDNIDEDAGYIMVNKAADDLIVGDIVSVSGTVESSNSQLRFGGLSNYSKTGHNDSFVQPATADKYTGVFEYLKYVNIIGNMTSSSGWLVTDATGNKLKVFANDKTDANKYVSVTGYLTHDTGSFKYLIATEIVEHTLTATPEELTWEANETDTKVVTIGIDKGADWTFSPTENTDWTVVKSDNELKVSPNAINTSTTSGKSLTITLTHSGNTMLTASIQCSQKPKPVVYEKYTDNLTEGYYLITYENGAMKNSVSSSRLEYVTITPQSDKVTDPAVSIVWKIAKSGNYWTIYNESVQKYAASTGAKNAAALNSSIDDKSLWTVTQINGKFEFVNKQNSENSVNAYLRKNGTYGFACYAKGTGGDLTLYKLDDGKTACANPTANPAAGEVAKDTKVTLSCATSGATIYYRIGTTDDFSPYSSDITIDAAKTIQAYAEADGYKRSEVVDFAYTVSGGQGGGTPHTYTMTIDSSNNGGNNVHWTGSSVTSLTYDNVTWLTSVTGNASFQASTTYCQVGTKNNPATKVSLTTSAFAGKTITSIKVTCFCMSNTGPTLTVTAGSTTMISGSALTKTTSTEMSSDTGVTATLGDTEELSIVFNSSAKAAICISKIEVKYTD